MRTFNMGIGLIIVTARDQAEAADRASSRRAAAATRA